MKNVVTARGFDFHCHIDLYADPAAMVSKCDAERIITLAVTTTPRAWPQNRAWAEKSRFVHVAAGLHPELVAQCYGEGQLLLDTIRRSPFVGEIGLDGSPPHRASLPRQREIFGQALDVSEEVGGRVLSIHSRGAASEVIDMLSRCTTRQRVLPILHWFSGSATDARRAIALGCFFSINPNMLENDRGRALVQLIPEDRLLIETDGPLATRGERPLAPPDSATIIADLAAFLKTSTGDLTAIVSRSADRVLRFAGAV